MLYLPDEYILALEEVLEQSLLRQALQGRKGRPFVEHIAKGVQTISSGLTRGRTGFLEGSYLNDKDIQRAYLAYYTTTNLLKIWPPLRELSHSGFFDNRSQLRHMDIGTGTGAALWGLATYLRHEQPQVTLLSSIATDSLQKNLEVVTRFARSFAPHIQPLKIDLRQSVWDIAAQAQPSEVGKSSPFDLITLMNVVNEVDEEFDASIINRLKSLLNEDGAIIMIEPSNREQSRRSLRFRDRLVESGLTVYSPCVRMDGCPALREEDNWCHTEVKWERPPLIEAVDEIAGTLRLSLKFTYGVFLKRDLNLSDVAQGRRDYYSAGRIVSELFNEKGRARMFVCNERGRLEYTLNKRDKSAGNRAMLKSDRYDLLQVEGVEVRASDVKVAEESVINILKRADGCGNVDKWALNESDLK